MAKLKLMLGAIAALGVIATTSAVSKQLGLNVAHAQSSSKAIVDSAKAEGVVGEQIDGYLAVVDGQSASADVQAAVRDINIARKAVYTKIAQKDAGASVQDVANLTGEKLVNNLPSGQWYRDSFGTWKQR